MFGEGDVMVDPKDQKFMPHKRDMIFIHKQGTQPQPSSTVEEVEEEEVDSTVNIDHEGASKGEAGPSKVKKSKLEKLQHEFDELKAETKSNFVAVRRQLQTYQFETFANFEVVINLLKILKAEF